MKFEPTKQCPERPVAFCGIIAVLAGMVLPLGTTTALHAQDAVAKQEVEIKGIATLNGDLERPIADAEIELVRLVAGKVTSRSKTKTDAAGKFVFAKQAFTLDRSHVEQLFIFGIDSRGVRVWKQWNAFCPEGRVVTFSGPDVTGYVQVVGDDGELKSTGPATQQPLTASLAFPKKHAALSGRILDSKGKPLAGRNVILVSGGEKGIVASGALVPNQVRRVLRAIPRGQNIQTMTDAGGRWSIEGFPESWEGEVEISTDQMTTVARVRSGRPAEISLPDSRKVELTIIDDKTGVPVPSAKTTGLLKRGQDQWTASRGETNDQGKITIDLPVGEVRVDVWPPEPNELNHYATAHSIDVGASSKSYTLKLQRCVTTTLSVVDADSGKPLPAILARPDRYSNLEHQTDTSKLQQGVTIIRSGKGRAKFAVNMLRPGYEVVNPMKEPLELVFGSDAEYTFRIRKMKEFRPPIYEDRTAESSPAHQEAVKRLRDLGAIVITNSECCVQLTQFWKGKPADFRWFKDLENFKTLMTFAYPVPKVFREAAKPEAPTVADEWLPHLSDFAELSVQFGPTELTDAGLIALKDSTLHELRVEDSKIQGKGLESLEKLRYLHLNASPLDLAAVDLSSCRVLESLRLFSSSAKSLAAPTLPSQLFALEIYPANAATITGLGAADHLRFLRIGGQEISDDVLPAFGEMSGLRTLILVNTSVTKSGLTEFRKSHPKLRVELTTMPRIK